jgi:hypothetical protein
VAVNDARAQLLLEEGQRDVGLALEVRGLAGDGDAPAPTKLDVTMDPARISVEGGARIAQPGFDGTVSVTDLSLPDMITISGALLPELLQQGKLGAELQVAAGSAAEPAGDVAVKGTVDLATFSMVGEDPKVFSVAFEQLAIGIDELRVPGVLAPPEVARKPPAVKLKSLDLVKPRIQLTRSPEGLVLPPFTPAAAPAAAGADGAPTPPAAPAEAVPARAPSPSAKAPPAAPGQAAPAPLDLTVAELHVKDGELRVTDRTVKPVFNGGLKALVLDVRGMRYPPVAIENMKLTTTSLTRGRLEVKGKLGPTGGQVEVNGKDIALEPFNPYATHYSPYSITGGALSVTSKATMKRGAYDSTTSLTLDRFDLGGKEGESLFKEQFGVPIEVALALLTDIQGRILFDIPVEGDERGTKVSVGTVVAQALRRAIVNALASPLKLVGAAFGGSGAAAPPKPIAFAVGRAEPTDDGGKALDALGGLLASRPGIGITLKTAPTKSDVRWLHEQKLREKLSRPQGVFGAIGNFTQRGARERVRVALEARAEGKKGTLEAEDEVKLEEWLAEEPTPGAKELRALATARTERAATALREGHGVAANRVATAEPVVEVREGDPVVEFDLGAAGMPAATAP